MLVDTWKVNLKIMDNQLRKYVNDRFVFGRLKRSDVGLSFFNSDKKESNLSLV